MSVISLLVANWYGNGEPCNGNGWSPANLRRALIEKIVRILIPDIILVQEGIPKVYKLVCDVLNIEPMLFAFENNREAGIVYNCTKFTAINPISDFFSFNQILMTNNIISADSQLYGRFKALVLKPKGPEPPFLVLSYHGRYNGVAENMRLIFLSDLLRLVVEYIRAKGMPAIIAGDFNVFVDQKMVDDMTRTFLDGPNTNFRVVPYETTGNRNNAIDHIIMSSTFELEKAYPIDIIKRISATFPYVNEGQSGIILDHDHIYASIYLPSK